MHCPSLCRKTPWKMQMLGWKVQIFCILKTVSRGRKSMHLWCSSESHFSFALQVCNAVSFLEHGRSGVMVLTDFPLQSFSLLQLSSLSLFLAYSASPQAKSRSPHLLSIPGTALQRLCQESLSTELQKGRGKKMTKKAGVIPMGKTGIYRKIGVKSSCWTWGWVGERWKKQCRNGIDTDSGDICDRIRFRVTTIFTFL